MSDKLSPEGAVCEVEFSLIGMPRFRKTYSMEDVGRPLSGEIDQLVEGFQGGEYDLFLRCEGNEAVFTSRDRNRLSVGEALRRVAPGGVIRDRRFAMDATAENVGAS